MRLFLLSLVVLSACSTIQADDKKPEQPKAAVEQAKPAPPPPIEVRAQAPKMAEIDPTTLKVTYMKGADPKAFAQEMVKAWAQAQGALGQCQQQLQAATAPKEKK